MHVDPFLPPLAGLALVVLILAALLRRLRQPYVVVYLVAGVVLGRHGLHLFEDEATVEHLGSLGVVLLLFFVGMEVSLPRLVSGWRIAVLGTGAQVAASVGAAFGLGAWLGWSPAKSVLIGFVISLSSTAVVLKVLRDGGEDDSRVGGNVTGVLLAQDLAVIPMMVVLGLLGGEATDTTATVVQGVSGVVFLVLLALLARRGEISLPIPKALREDHEMQVYGGLSLCFGLAWLTAVLGLSTALGAFFAGLLIGAGRETKWVHGALAPFQVVFVGLFFISVGMLLDLGYVAEHWVRIAALVAVVLLLNTAVGAVVFRALGESWRESVYGGALLAQIGEFSFVLASIGLHLGIIGEMGYQTTVSVITVSLFLSPAWIFLFRRSSGVGPTPGTAAA